MKSKFAVTGKYFGILFVLIIGIVSIIGSGGGGGGSTSNVSNLGYTGVTTQATIDENNSYDIALAFWEGQDSSSSLNIFGAIESDPNIQESDSLSVEKISNYFIEFLGQIELYSNENSSYVGAIQTISDTIYGPCGGSATYNMQGDDVTGDVSGNVSFNNYCESGVIADGSANISGKLDMQNEEIVYITIDFQNVTVNDSQGSYNIIGINGSMRLDVISPTSIKMTLNAVLKDNANNTYWYENFILSMSAPSITSNYADATFSGRYYHYGYGYITISTIEPVRLYINDDYPFSGVLLLAGKNGSKGKFEFIDNSSFQVSVDPDGDGVYQYNTGTILWSEKDQYCIDSVPYCTSNIGGTTTTTTTTLPGTTTTTLPGGTPAINQYNIGEITNGINAFVSLGDNINGPEDLLGTPVCEAGDVTTSGSISNPPVVGQTIIVTYYACQEFGVIMDGTMTMTITEVSGDISGNPPHSLTIRLMYNDLTTEDVISSLVSTSSADMYISLSEDGTGNFSIIMQGNLTEQSETEVVTLSDFLMELTYNQFTFAHSLNLIGDIGSTLIGGSVSFNTITPFTGNDNIANGDPTAGVLHVTNSIDNSQALITALPDGLSLKIEVDADGDGVYEYVDSIPWADL